MAQDDADTGEPPPAGGYRRFGGSPRGHARRRDLLARVTDDVQANGLADFSLRRAARAAGTTHKVLLYYFHDADELLAEAVGELRRRRIAGGRATSVHKAGSASFVDRVLGLWPVLIGAEDAALEQAVGLAMYDPTRYAGLVEGATEEYVVALQEMCPARWPPQRKREVAQMVLGTFRGLLLARRTGGDDGAADAGLAALRRALVRELAARR